MVGKSALLPELGLATDFAELGEEGIAIRTAGPSLTLLGDRRGVLYACYALLDELLGCRWFTRDFPRVARGKSLDPGLWTGPGLGSCAVQLTPLDAEYSRRSPNMTAARDATGLSRFCAEGCSVAAVPLSISDHGSNSRSVVWRCVFNNSGVASHGADTSTQGLRHFELYDNTSLSDDLGGELHSLNSWLYLRGSTRVVADNTTPDTVSEWWGDRPEIGLTGHSCRRDCI